jgi:hypothetical protein
MNMNSSDRSGIINTTLMNSVLFVSRIKDAIVQHKQTSPAEEWYM